MARPEQRKTKRIQQNNNMRMKKKKQKNKIDYGMKLKRGNYTD